MYVCFSSSGLQYTPVKMFQFSTLGMVFGSKKNADCTLGVESKKNVSFFHTNREKVEKQGF